MPTKLLVFTATALLLVRPAANGSAAIKYLNQKAGQISLDTYPDAREHLHSALKKLSVESLGNLNPHPLYVAVHYSHPPILERLANLKK